VNFNTRTSCIGSARSENADLEYTATGCCCTTFEYEVVKEIFGLWKDRVSEKFAVYTRK
jgi:hypothetical protein